MITYTLDFAAGYGGPANIRVSTEVLPRVGDTIEVDGIEYDVIAVWHVVSKNQETGTDYGSEQPPSPTFDWTVRVTA